MKEVKYYYIHVVTDGVDEIIEETGYYPDYPTTSRIKALHLPIIVEVIKKNNKEIYRDFITKKEFYRTEQVKGYTSKHTYRYRSSAIGFWTLDTIPVVDVAKYLQGLTQDDIYRYAREMDKLEDIAESLEVQKEMQEKNKAAQEREAKKFIKKYNKLI